MSGVTPVSSLALRPAPWLARLSTTMVVCISIAVSWVTYYLALQHQKKTIITVSNASRYPTWLLPQARWSGVQPSWSLVVRSAFEHKSN